MPLTMFGASVLLALFISLQDPFLNLWDEQYHALVAKNLSNNFLMPTLYSQPVLPFDYKNWVANHVWLHKQPFFLWLMALSIKLFGVTELSIRIPSILLHGILPILVFRTGTNFSNRRIGFYAAVLIGTSHYILELTTGKFSTDHNDLMFLVFMSASYWAFSEYYTSKNRKWLYLLGFFCGISVLIKWLMGLLPLLIWGLWELYLVLKNRKLLNSSLEPLWALLVSLLVFIPWQIYALIRFPREFFHEYVLNAMHFTNVIEGHDGEIDYYFTDGLRKIYGDGDAIPFIMLFGFLLLVFRYSKKEVKWFIFIVPVFIYLFFTSAQTKMTGFVLIASPFIFFGFGAIIKFLEDLIRKYFINKWFIEYFSLPIIVLLGILNFNYSAAERLHTNKDSRYNQNRAYKLAEKKFILNCKKTLPANTVLFNASLEEKAEILFMFYTDIIAYSTIPSEGQIISLIENGYNVAIVLDQKVPKFIENNRDIDKVTWSYSK